MELKEVEEQIDITFRLLCNDKYLDKEINLKLKSINFCYTKFVKELKQKLKEKFA